MLFAIQWKVVLFVKKNWHCTLKNELFNRTPSTSRHHYCQGTRRFFNQIGCETHPHCKSNLVLQFVPLDFKLFRECWNETRFFTTPTNSLIVPTECRVVDLEVVCLVSPKKSSLFHSNIKCDVGDVKVPAPLSESRDMNSQKTYLFSKKRCVERI